jgi:hypothetical protein
MNNDFYCVAFFHAAVLGHWQIVNTELLSAIRDSKLLNELIEVNIGVVGNREEFELPFNAGKFCVEYLGGLEEFEYATQEYMQNMCTAYFNSTEWRKNVGIPINTPVCCLYICNAGVSHPPNHDLYPEWRHLMTHYNITNWRECVKYLQEGYDTVGIEWQTNPVPHWSGNFWWANSRYIESLPSVADMRTFDAGSGINHKTHPRHGAEWWIGRDKNVKYKSLFQTGYSWRNRPRKDWLQWGI